MRLTGLIYVNIGKLVCIQYLISIIIIPEKNDNTNEKLVKKDIFVSSFLNLRTFPAKFPYPTPVKHPIAIRIMIYPV